MATSMTPIRFLEKYEIKTQMFRRMQNANSAKAFIPPHLLHDIWTEERLSFFLDTLKPEDTSDYSLLDAFELLHNHMLVIISILVYIQWDDWTTFWPKFISFDPFTPLSSTERPGVLNRNGSKQFDRLDDFLPFAADELGFLEGQAQQFLDAQYIFKPITIFERVDGTKGTHSSLERLPFIKEHSRDLEAGSYGKVTREVVAVRCLYHRTSTSADLIPNVVSGCVSDVMAGILTFFRKKLRLL
jgi:hypothetical protein